MKKLVIIVRMIGPYHHARFNTLSKYFNVNVFETRPNIHEYDWKTIDTEEILYSVFKNLYSDKKKNKQLITKYLQENYPDFIITHGWADYEYLVALKFAKNAKIPIATLTDSTLIDYKRNWVKETFKRSIANCFDGYFAAGTKSIEYLHSLEIFSRIFTPCDVVDNEYFKRKVLAIHSGQNETTFQFPSKYILCVSRFIPKKNLLLLLKAYTETVSGNKKFQYKLVIVGSGHLKDDIENIIQQSSIKDSVCIFDFAQYAELPQFYAKASALIIPSISDQWGLVVNEAMACGLPVLVSENCGCSIDLVENGKNGFIFQPNQIGILTVLEDFNNLDNESIKKMGQESAIKINNYSLLAFAEAVIRLVNLPSHKITYLKRLYLKIICSI